MILPFKNCLILCPMNICPDTAITLEILPDRGRILAWFSWYQTWLYTAVLPFLLIFYQQMSEDWLVSQCLFVWASAGYLPVMKLFNSYDAYMRIHIWGTRSSFLRQGQVIISHSLPWDAITYPCLRYLFLSPKSSCIIEMGHHWF